MTIWAILPAAGIGRRMGSVTPKQYLPLNGLPVIAHALQKLASIDDIRRIVVVLHPQDEHFSSLNLSDIVKSGNKITTAVGGDERFQSVLNGLLALRDQAASADWVLVHDAVRPCVRISDIHLLLDTLSNHAVGGLLGVPLEDTLKRVNTEAQVVETVDRSQYWRAQTPQMFRYGLLMDALEKLLAAGEQATDEAGAVERTGVQPQMVAGHKDNIKITESADLAMASTILQAQQDALARERA